VNPVQKREILDVALITDRYNTYGYEKRSRLLTLAGAIHPRVGAACAALAAPEEWQILHAATSVTVVPPRKPDRWDIEIGVFHARGRIFVLGRQPEGLHGKTSLEAFLRDQPFRGTGLSGKRPSVETGHHERLVFREVDHRTHAERADELRSPDGLQCWHRRI